MANVACHRRASSVSWSDIHKTNQKKNRLSIGFVVEQEKYKETKQNSEKQIQFWKEISQPCANEQLHLSVGDTATIVGSVNINNSGISMDAGLQTKQGRTSVILSLSSEIPIEDDTIQEEETPHCFIPLKRTTSVGILFDISKQGASIKKTGKFSQATNPTVRFPKARSTPTSAEDGSLITETILGFSFNKFNPLFHNATPLEDSDDGQFILHKQQIKNQQPKNIFAKTLSQIMNFNKEKKKSDNSSSNEKSPLSSPRINSNHQIKTTAQVQCASNCSSSSNALTSSGEFHEFQFEDCDPYLDKASEQFLFGGEIQHSRPIDAKKMKELKNQLELRKLLVDKKQIEWICEDARDTPTFETARKIGEGGFGYVRLASYNNQLVAVKKILVLDSPDYVFHNEVSIMLDIDRSSENIIQLLGVCFDERFIILPFIPGSTIADYIKIHVQEQLKKKIPLQTSLKICLDIAKAFKYLHACKPRVIHRDLTTRNVLHQIDKSNNVRVFLCDFGISRKEINGKGNPQPYTWIGHPCYKAPEVRNRLPYNYKVDVFSFGTFLYEVVGTSLLRPEQVPPLDCTFLNDFQKDIRKLILKCWSIKPSDRPSFVTICSKLKKIMSKLK